MEKLYYTLSSLFLLFGRASKFISIVIFFIVFQVSSLAQVSLTTLGSAYTQNFDGFDLGTIADLPANWAAGGAQDYNPGGVYSNTGAYSSSNSSYSLRNAATTDYAWGAKVAANSGNPTGTGIETITLTVVNNTGSTITSFDVSWVGEQYSQDDRASFLRFSYSINGGAFIDLTAQDVVATVNATPASGNGVNLNPIASTSRSTTISGISLLNGQQAQFRFSVQTGAGSDNNAHIGVDDFSLTPQGAVPTTTIIASNLNPSFTGNNVTFTATVTSGGNPVTTGTVDFKEGAITLQSNVPLNGSGQATFSTSVLTEGSHNITAIYNGTASFLTSNGSIVQVVNNMTVVNGNSFCNEGSITLPDGGGSATSGNIGTPGTPYPSNIMVSGLSGTITSMTVDVKGLTHDRPQDIDLLLVAPTGEKFIIMSGVGGGTFNNTNLTLSDAAASALPRDAAIPSGTYRPASYEADARNIFPAPAPVGPYNQPDREGTATFASVFNGLDPNGTWQLYATDDTTNVSGSINNGWCLNISTVAPCAISSVTFSDQQPCDDNGTMDQTDDFYTADITINFMNPPATGFLELEQSGAVIDVVRIAVGSLVGNSHTFQDVRLKANGMVNAVEAQFSADEQNCVRTAGAPAVNSCSPVCSITSIMFSDQQGCNNNGTMDQTDDYYTADITINFMNPPATGFLELEQSGAVMDVVNIAVGSLVGNSHTFQDVRLKANGMVNAVEAQFSADEQNCVRTAGAPAVNSCPCIPPAITDEPDAITKCAGEAASFNVIASGFGTLSYQWQENGVNLSNGGVYSGVNTATLNISDVTGLNGKQYKVVITNDNGTLNDATDDCSTTSEEVTLTVDPTPQVDAVSNMTYCAGDNVPAVVFTSNVLGATFDWSRTNEAIGLGTNSGIGNVPSFTATNNTSSPITATFSAVASYENNGVKCTGTPIQFTITINPSPQVNAISNMTYCVGDTVPSVVFMSNVQGATFDWSRTNEAIGLNTNSGMGNVPLFVATNNTGSPITATFSAVASYENNGVKCTGTPIQFTIAVNPRVVVEAGTVEDALCLTKTVDLTQIGASITIGNAPFTGTWSILEEDSDGQFLPSNAFGTATAFQPGKADGKRGYVTLVLTSNDPDGNGPCPSDSDRVRIKILNVDCGQFPWNGGNNK